MAKLSVQRLLEVSKLLATDAGKQLEELITFVNDVSDQTLRALRQGLTFQDNFNAKIATVSAKHNVETVVAVDGKRPLGAIPLRVISTKHGIDGFSVYINNQGLLAVKVAYTANPSVPTEALDVKILILFE